MQQHRTRVLLASAVLAFAFMSTPAPAAPAVERQAEAKPAAPAGATPQPAAPAGATTRPAAPASAATAWSPPGAPKSVPDQDFSHPPEKPHDPAAFFFNFDQLDYYYRVPGEFTYRLTGDQYGFETLSFIISETLPGGGPGLHVHDTEEAHVLLQGTAQYRIGDQTFTVQAPYIARVPAGVPHTFINAGTTPFNLVAVFSSKHPTSKRIGPNPLISLVFLPRKQEEPPAGTVPP